MQLMLLIKKSITKFNYENDLPKYSFNVLSGFEYILV